ncbi:MAG TPA: ferrochelatase, partial [Chloroflexota bacterium]
RIDATRSRLAREWGGPIHLLLSAHGLPLRYVEQGDDYPRQVRRTAEALGTLLPEFAGWRLGYQSRMGPVHWLQPSTHTVLERLAAEGARAIVAVPLGFVSDHIETLYDLDILYRDEAVAMGIRHYRRVPSFNADPGFAALIADLAGACDMELTGQHSVPASRAGKDRQGWSDDD